MGTETFQILVILASVGNLFKFPMHLRGRIVSRIGLKYSEIYFRTQLLHDL